MTTLDDLLCSLRQRLLDAWERNDAETLSSLMTTFGVFREESYAMKNQALTLILVALEDATRDALMGFKSKGEVPSAEAIKAAVRGLAHPVDAN